MEMKQDECERDRKNDSWRMRWFESMQTVGNRFGLLVEMYVLNEMRRIVFVWWDVSDDVILFVRILSAICSMDLALFCMGSSLPYFKKFVQIPAERLPKNNDVKCHV